MNDLNARPSRGLWRAHVELEPARHVRMLL